MKRIAIATLLALIGLGSLAPDADAFFRRRVVSKTVVRAGGGNVRVKNVTRVRRF